MVQKLRCLVRGELVAATAEEQVRQSLLEAMVCSLGFPKPLIAVERELASFPSLQLTERPPPNRRIDVVCFAKGIRKECDFSPLLLVECKAVPFTSRAIRQITGYNFFVHSPFISLVNQEEIRCGWFDPVKKKYDFVPFLPPYQELLKYCNIG